MQDLVSYNQKHNEANGEENRDGRNENYSYNHGVEGSTESLSEPQKSAVENNRTFAQSGLLMSLLLANGTPMLLAGDEFGNTQYGNNNAYCQDNEITWLKWVNFNKELFELAKQTIAARKQIGSLNRNQWWSGDNVQWLNIHGNQMTVDDWQNQQTKALQVVLDKHCLLLINAKAEGQVFRLPDGKWKPQIGTHNLTLDIQQAELSSMGFCMLSEE